ncbi:hypothetical protein MAR_035809 [Mya arenaria]|uniref:Uncharacterized protein n=1 Tax=Mya arenaria TaxID=6604 RepID=A0ABY7EQ81_MYAAR|nr:hypothetical protein MAR_035809 [Mya arenaria]
MFSVVFLLLASRLLWRYTKDKASEYDKLRISGTCINAHVKRTITSFMYHIGYSKNRRLSGLGMDTSSFFCIPDPNMTRDAFWQNVVRCSCMMSSCGLHSHKSALLVNARPSRTRAFQEMPFVTVMYVKLFQSIKTIRAHIYLPGNVDILFALRGSTTAHCFLIPIEEYDSPLPPTKSLIWRSHWVSFRQDMKCCITYGKVILNCRVSKCHDRRRNEEQELLVGDMLDAQHQNVDEIRHAKINRGCLPLTAVMPYEAVVKT